MNKSQKGFSHIAILALLIIVIAGIGYLVWQHQNSGLKITYSGPPKTWDTNTKFPTSKKPQTVSNSCYSASLPGNFLVEKNGACDIGASRGADGAVLTITSEMGDLGSIESKYKQKMGTKDAISESDIMTKNRLKVHLMTQATDPDSQYGIWQQVFIFQGKNNFVVINGAEPISSKSDNVYQNIADSLLFKS